MGTYAGVDLGATNVRAVVGNSDGEILGVDRRSTPQGPSGIAVTEAILDTLRGACAGAGVEPERVRAVGIGSIGPLDLAAGAVEDPVNIPAVDRIPLTGPVEKLVGGDVYLHNDTSAGVIGERFYADRNPDDMVYLTISSGIGAGVCVDGKVLSGWDGNAGEVGHQTVDPEGRLTCGCGTPGHWEAYCSGENIPRFARHVHEQEGFETALAVESDGLRAAEVFAAAEEGDPLGEAVVERLGRWNTQGIANVVHAFAPLVIYVGGAVALHNPEQVLGPVRERLAERTMINVPEVQLTTLGDDVVVKGALASAVTDGTGDQARAD
jgi:glucokinase